MIELRRILYPTDFSEHSVCALEYARELAKRFEAELHCLYVADESYQYWMGAGGEAAVPMVMPLEDVKKAAEQQMEQFVEEQFGGERQNLVSRVISGRPFLEIIRYARENQMDLIVIATHGRGALVRDRRASGV